MEWIERLNDAIGYIEEHLTDEIASGYLFPNSHFFVC